MNSKSATTLLGEEEVPVLRRSWVSSVHIPYKKTYNLLPGQHWSEAEESLNKWEQYVKIRKNIHVPVGALITHELIDEGAITAAFTEQGAGKYVLVNQNLFCISGKDGLVQVLDNISNENGGCLDGLPEVIALFPDGKISFRKAENVTSRKKPDQKQHDLARLLRQLYGSKLDIAVVEWGCAE